MASFVWGLAGGEPFASGIWCAFFFFPAALNINAGSRNKNHTDQDAHYKRHTSTHVQRWCVCTCFYCSSRINEGNVKSRLRSSNYSDRFGPTLWTVHSLSPVCNSDLIKTSFYSLFICCCFSNHDRNSFIFPPYMYTVVSNWLKLLRRKQEVN